MNIKEIAEFTEKTEKCVRHWVELANNSDFRLRDKINNSKNITSIDFSASEVITIIKKGAWKNKRILSYFEANIRGKDFEHKTGIKTNACFTCYYFHPCKSGEDHKVYCMHKDNVKMIHDPINGMVPAIKDCHVSFIWNKENDCLRFKMGSIHNYDM